MRNSMFGSIFGFVIAALMVGVKMSVADANGGGLDGTSVAQSGGDVFSKDTGAGSSQAGGNDPIAPFCPEISGGGNAAAGSSGGKPEINDNYTFGARNLTPGGSGGKSGD